MNTLKQDIISLLKYYVERESEEERKLIEDQQACGLTVCLNVHYVSNNTENNVIMVHTQLHQLNETQENTLKSCGDLDHFYIKSQMVSHKTRKSHSHSYYSGEIITTETVVTKFPNKCEIVYKTHLYKTDNGKLQQTQRSFTREIIKNKINNKELKRGLSLVQKNDNVNTIYINNDRNAEDFVSKNKITDERNEKPKLKKMTSIKRLKSFIMKKDVDSNKKNILNAEKLEPIKKPKKSIKKRLKNWFNKSVSTPINPIITTTDTRKKSLIELKKCISTEDSEMEKEKPTNIIARISTDTETKQFEIIKDNLCYADEDNNNPIELSASELHCNFKFSILTENNLKNEMELCNCNKRSMEAIINFIIGKLNGIELDEEEINKFDTKTQHFIDCSYSKISAKNGRLLSKSSTISSPNSLSPFDNNQFSRGRSGSVISLNSESHLDTIFDTMKFSNDIYCPKETINYFINSKNYEHYEKGLLKVLDTKISLENMILLFYLTRNIVKQIDDPTCYENDDIKRIMNFSEKFFIKQYYHEISTHGNMEKFILHYDSVD